MIYLLLTFYFLHIFFISKLLGKLCIYVVCMFNRFRFMSNSIIELLIKYVPLFNLALRRRHVMINMEVGALEDQAVG